MEFAVGFRVALMLQDVPERSLCFFCRVPAFDFGRP